MLIAGALLLVKGADLLVDGGTGIALKSGVSQLVVGLTVVAFGTSAPELTVSLTAALQGAGDVCFGNVVGSNIANIGLILGVTALIGPVTVNRSLLKWELPFLIFISALTMGIGYTFHAGRLAGIILLALFGWYLYHCYKSPGSVSGVEDIKTSRSYLYLSVLVVLGIAGLGFGGTIFVNGARTIARMFGISEAVIGLTVVALGTSLPELVTSVVAAVKQQADISLGNIVGSNIFNILLVIGTTASISPFAISPDRYLMYVGMPFMMIVALLLIPFAAKDALVSRLEGAGLFTLYIITIILAVVMTI